MTWAARSMPAEERVDRRPGARRLNFAELAFAGFFYCPVCGSVHGEDNYCLRCRHYRRWHDGWPVIAKNLAIADGLHSNLGDTKRT